MTTIRKGHLDWVTGIANASEFRSWSFAFSKGAKMFLSVEAYTKEDERMDAFMNAYLRAAHLGGFDDMRTMLELYDRKGIKGEEILKKLQDRYLPTAEIEKKKAMQNFLKFDKGGRSLFQAVKDLNVLLLECFKAGYQPDDLTVQGIFEGLVPANQLTLYRILKEKMSSLKALSALTPEEDLKYTMQAVEEMGKVQEMANMANDEPPFAGGAFGKDKRGKGKGKWNPKRKGYNNAENGTNDREQAQQKSKCTRCGKRCPYSKGQPLDTCYAYNKDCHKCGGKGHYGPLCKTKPKEGSKAAGKAYVALSAKEPTKATRAHPYKAV